MSDWNYEPERRVPLSDIADAIRESVSMESVVQTYAPHLQLRRGRLQCPFHNGHDYNMALYGTGYKCYVCGAAGDAISFVADILGCGRLDAMKAMNNDMLLGLPIDGPVQASQRNDIDRIAYEHKMKKAAQEAYQRRYNELMDEWCRLDKTMRSALPMTDEWADAVKRMPIVQSELDALEEPK